MVLFSEDHIQETRRRGRIEVICGSMFSGKTEELIRRMKRAKFAKQRVEIFKPAIDTRYSEEDVVSHDSHSIASTPIDSSASILLFTSEIDVVDCLEWYRHCSSAAAILCSEFHRTELSSGNCSKSFSPLTFIFASYF